MRIVNIGIVHIRKRIDTIHTLALYKIEIDFISYTMRTTGKMDFDDYEYEDPLDYPMYDYESSSDLD